MLEEKFIEEIEKYSRRDLANYIIKSHLDSDMKLYGLSYTDSDLEDLRQLIKDDLNYAYQPDIRELDEADYYNSYNHFHNKY